MSELFTEKQKLHAKTLSRKDIAKKIFACSLRLCPASAGCAFFFLVAACSG
jgi:hypothetical protein